MHPRICTSLREQMQLPVFIRELRVQARSHWTFTARAIVAATLAFATVVIVWISNEAGVGLPIGSLLPTGLGVLGFGYSFVVGLGFAHESLLAEKRDNTLGLVLLSGLGPYRFIVGKMCAASVRAGQIIMAGVPALAVAALIDTLNSGKCFWVIIAVAASLLFWLALGLLLAMMVLLGARWLGAIAVGMLFILLAYMTVPYFYELPLHITMWSPDAALRFALTEIDSWEPSPGYVAALASLLLEMLALVTASGWLLDLSWRRCALPIFKSPAPPVAKPARRATVFARLWTWLCGTASRSAVQRQHLLNLNPMYWLRARTPRFAVIVWGAGLSSYVLIPWAMLLGVRFHATLDEWYGSWLICTFVSLVIAHCMAVIPGLRLFEDRQNGALELVAVAPDGVGNILRGHDLLLDKVFLRPFIWYSLANIALAWLVFLPLMNNEDARWPLLACLPLAHLVTAASVPALCWASLWYSLKVRRASDTYGWAALRWYGWPAAIVLVSFCAAAYRHLHGTEFPSAGFWLPYAALVLVAHDWRVIRWARRRLRAEMYESITASLVGPGTPPGLAEYLEAELRVGIGRESSPDGTRMVRQFWRERFHKWRWALVISGTLLCAFGVFRWYAHWQVEQRLAAMRTANVPLTVEQVRKLYAGAPSARGETLYWFDQALQAYTDPNLVVSNFYGLEFWQQIGSNAVPSDAMQLIREVLNSNAVTLACLDCAVTADRQTDEQPASLTLPVRFEKDMIQYLHGFARLQFLAYRYYLQEADAGKVERILSAESLVMRECLQTADIDTQLVARKHIQGLTSLLRWDLTVNTHEESFLQMLAGHYESFEHLVASDLRPALQMDRCQAMDLLLASPGERQRRVWGYSGWDACTMVAVLGLFEWTGVSDCERTFFLNGSRERERIASEPYPRRFCEIEELNRHMEDPVHPLYDFARWQWASGERLFTEDAETIAALGEARIAIALERYRLACDGCLPERLADLVPGFISQLPADPYTGLEFQYEITGDGYILSNGNKDHPMQFKID